MLSTVKSRLERENEVYAGSGGISQNNRTKRFLPAFKNSLTGEVVLSRFANGTTAPFHLIDALPNTWIDQIDEQRRELKEHIISGFVRQGQFFNRQQAADLIAEAV
ncbi:hypothetical protein [uncultured Neptuniibacter sp.]|uniref:hypothetical protein n=1 Tax=uncultured Neptuniibacter sp. TaxID=502143 RepID=UPI0026382BE2|nr:hypothetical protein [uncultured Neptuniibacter sp.]